MTRHNTKLIQVEDLKTEGLNLWASDAFHFDFVLRYWANSHRINTSFICIQESDFVMNATYFLDVLTRIKPDIAYVQHFWGHREFEAINTALLCASKTASLSTRLWVYLMYFFYKKRYRRLLFLPVLFFLQKNKYVFEWDLDKGCTSYYPHCNYIHFTKPKSEGIEEALSEIILQS